MKLLKIIALFILIFICSKSYGQTNTFPVTGNVGIGIASPLYKLDVSGSFRFGGTGAYSSMIMNTEDTSLVGYHQSSYITPSTIPGSGTAKSMFRFKNNIGAIGKTLIDVVIDGNLGIGTTTPNVPLYIQNASTNYTTSITLKNTANHVAARPGFTLENDLGKQTYLYKQASGNTDANDLILYSVEGNTRIYTGGIERLAIENSGNIGIGIRNAAEKLAVNGKIRAKEIKVETANWPDYVFAKNYGLASLKETEQHIKEKGHLPGIPSAEEVKANGIDLGEMNAKLLQKIEELTLHLIEQNKKINDLQSEIKRINSKL